MTFKRCIGARQKKKKQINLNCFLLSGEQSTKDKNKG